MSIDIGADLQKAYDDGYEEGKHNAAPRWVRCDDRLPMYGQEVLAARLYGDGEIFYEIITAHLCDIHNERGVWNATNITHWMPLPEPPKEG